MAPLDALRGRAGGAPPVLPPAGPALAVRGLRRSWPGVEALAGVDLEVQPGEVTALVGPNGAGKTTLLSAVAGLVRPDGGSVSVLGVDALVRPAAARRQLGLAPQRLGLTGTQTVEDNLVFFARLAGCPPADARRRATATADRLGLGGVLGRRAGRLSGGEQRRAHVACALVHDPPLVLLDEPTAGVDPSGRDLLLEAIRDLGRRGTAVCVATHRFDEVEALGATVAVLHRGRLVARDAVAALVARHGRSVVEVRFDDEVVRVVADDPGRAVADVLAAKGQGARLLSVDVVRGGLESAFLALTGERWPGPEAA